MYDWSPFVYFFGIALIVRLLFLITAFFAARKGYAWYCWIVSLGVVGLIVMAFLPFANHPDASPQINEARRRQGNTLGIILSTVELIGVAVGVLLFVIMLPTTTSDPTMSRLIWMLTQSPFLLASAVGIVVLITRYSKCPRAAILAILGLAVLLMTNVSSMIVYFVIEQWMNQSHDFEVKNIEWLYRMIGLIRSFLDAGSIVLLLWAVMTGRSRHPSVAPE